MSTITITGPAVEPVPAADVKARSRIDGTEFDSQIAILIPAIRQDAEARLGRKLVTQTLELVLDAFPAAEIDLRLPDVTEIVSVKYLDAAAVEQTLATSAYSLDARETPEASWLIPAHGTAWPATLDAANAVRVRFKVGYGETAADVPEAIRYWIIARVAAELGADATPFIDHLLDPFKVY